jgi:hypothetical protein
VRADRARITFAPGVQVRLVLLALFAGGVVAIQVRVFGVALDALGNEVAVRHRMADDHDLEAFLLQESGEVAGGLALACAGAGRAGREDGLRARDHRPRGPEQFEIGAAGERPTGGVHDVLVGDVAVGEDDQIGVLVGDHALQLGLGKDRDAGRIELAGELGRVVAAGDARDLGRRSEGHDLVVGIVTVSRVEVVEVAPCGSHDDDASSCHGLRPFGKAAPSAMPGCEPWG